MSPELFAPRGPWLHFVVVVVPCVRPGESGVRRLLWAALARRGAADTARRGRPAVRSILRRGTARPVVFCRAVEYL